MKTRSAETIRLATLAAGIALFGVAFVSGTAQAGYVGVITDPADRLPDRFTPNGRPMTPPEGFDPRIRLHVDIPEIGYTDPPNGEGGDPDGAMFDPMFTGRPAHGGDEFVPFGSGFADLPGVVTFGTPGVPAPGAVTVIGLAAVAIGRRRRR